MNQEILGEVRFWIDFYEANYDKLDAHALQRATDCLKIAVNRLLTDMDCQQALTQSCTGNSVSIQ